MNEITTPPSPGRMQVLPEKRPRFYRNRLVVYPLLISAGVFMLTTHPFIALVVYVLSKKMITSFRGQNSPIFSPADMLVQEHSELSNQISHLNLTGSDDVSVHSHEYAVDHCNPFDPNSHAAYCPGGIFSQSWSGHSISMDDIPYSSSNSFQNHNDY